MRRYMFMFMFPKSDSGKEIAIKSLELLQLNTVCELFRDKIYCASHFQSSYDMIYLVLYRILEYI
jgi:hypothetical protein